MVLSLKQKKAIRLLLTGILTLFIVLSLFYKFYFLRQPERITPGDNSLFVSPANGVVMAVEEWNSDSLLLKKNGNDVMRLYTGDIGKRGTLVSIKLNLLNVHYQRAPTGGKYLGNLYKEGDFQYALKKEGKYGFRMQNEANVLFLESATGIPYRVIQIAGVAARRIYHYPSPEDWVEQGEVIGLISMGSQVAIVFTDEVDIQVKPGDELIDGETIVATQKIISGSKIINAVNIDSAKVEE